MIKIENIENIKSAAQEFINQIETNKIFAFNGEMGAGKTTFIKAICEVLGVKETINSPTFSIINEYEAADGRIIFHFDCYRINKIQEALDFGAEEYLYSGNLCFIEWSEKIAPLLPQDYINVNINAELNGTREIKIEKKLYKTK